MSFPFPIDLLAAQKMQGIAKHRMSEREEVKAIMERIEKTAEAGEFYTILHQDVDYQNIDTGNLLAYLSLEGFHAVSMSEKIIVSWHWKVTPLMPIEEALCNISKSIDNIE